MKTNYFACIAFWGLTALLTASCSKIPQAEIDAANASVEQAKIAGADIYAHESYVALQDSLKETMAAIESQKSKMFKNYSTVKEQLARVTQLAGESGQQAEIRKEELKEEIQNTIAEVKSLIESDRQLILEAPKGKEGTSALVAIKGELNAIEASMNETNTLFEAGDYLATIDKARVAKEKATSIKTELSEVIAKYKTNVRNRKS